MTISADDDLLETIYKRFVWYLMVDEVSHDPLDLDRKLRVEGAVICLKSILLIFAPHLIEKAEIAAQVNMALEPYIGSE